MSLTELISHRNATHTINYLDRELLKTIDEIYNLLKVCGFNTPRPLHATPEKFIAMSSQKKELIYQSLFGYLTVLQESPLSSYDIDMPDPNLERRMSDIALKKLKLNIPEEFFRRFHNGDVIEFYDTGMMQIYRNLEFFKYCSYNLIDLITLEWFELYERPSAVMQMAFTQWKNFLQTGSTDLKNYHIPEHLVLEKLLDVQRVFKVRTKDPFILKGSEGEVAGIAHSLSIELVASGPNTDQIAII